MADKTWGEMVTDNALNGGIVGVIAFPLKYAVNRLFLKNTHKEAVDSAAKASILTGLGVAVAGTIVNALPENTPPIVETGITTATHILVGDGGTKIIGG